MYLRCQHMRNEFIISPDKNNGYPSFPDSVEFDSDFYKNQSLFLVDSTDYPVFRNKSYMESILAVNTAFYADGKDYPELKNVKWTLNRNEYELVSPVPAIPLICVHDGNSVRNSPEKNYDFTTNGIRIIRPKSCVVTEELNGKYICELEHHIDSEGDWLTLAENNILSVPILYHNTLTTQLFRISKINEERKISAYHIWYDLSARAITQTTLTNLDGFNALSYLFASVYINSDGEEPVNKYWYPYQYASDITDTYTADYSTTTLSASILGEDNSLTNQLGGEIYRDNFYFSINKSKENSIKNENSIRYGVDMIDIKEEVDWGDFSNYLIAYDNFGASYAVSWADYYGGELGKICRVKNFNYDEYNFDQLVKDTDNYFDKICRPQISYTIRFANLRNTELYKDFINLQNNEVGDIIKIFNERLKIETEVKVISKKYDVLHKKTLEIKLGTEKASIVKKSYLSNTVFQPSADVRALQKKVGI